MKFEFANKKNVDIATWTKCNEKLEQDLKTISNSHIPEAEVFGYLADMIQELSPVDTMQYGGPLFLMYDEPSTMPADARVDFVYRPTYIAASILMTAINRYDGISANKTMRKIAHDMLEACLGRNFVGAGYNEYTGLISTLKIFAQGDVIEFIVKFPYINERFTIRMNEALTFLETEICSGKIKDVWSGDDYSQQGREVLAMFRNRRL